MMRRAVAVVTRNSKTSNNNNQLCQSCTTRLSRSLFNNSSGNTTMTTAPMFRNKHFMIVQWPTSDVTVKVDESKTLKEQNELLHDIANYAESQTQRLLNLQAVDSKRNQLEFVPQQSRLLQSILSEKDSDKSAFFEDPSKHMEPITYNQQLNLITLIDRTPVDNSYDQLQKLLKLEEEKREKQLLQQKRQQKREQKKAAKEVPLHQIQEQQQHQPIEEEEHVSSVSAKPSQ